MYCCLTREPHFACSMLKEIPAELLAAEKSFTGMDTSPKEMLAVPIARALMASSVAGGLAGGEKSGEGLGELRSLASLLVLEEDVCLAPGLRRDLLRPAA